MKDVFDCLILLPDNPDNWIIEWKSQFEKARTRYILHHFFTLSFDIAEKPNLDNLKTIINRYDFVILPVSPLELSWARTSIVYLTSICNLPSLGVTKDLQLYGIQDLFTLGITNVVRANYDLEEGLLRLFQAHKTKKLLSKKPTLDSEPPELNQSTETEVDPRNFFNFLFCDENIPPFGEFKQLYVSRFEQSYLISLLRLFQGNVTNAAKAAKKHRRAFWELLKKHGINAKDFENL